MKQKNININRINLSNIWQKILEQKNHTIYGVPELSTANFLITNLLTNPPDKSKSAVFCLVKNSLEARHTELLLKYWQKIFPHDFAVLNFTKEKNSWLYSLINKKPFILIITLSDLEEKINCDISNFSQTILKINKNTELKPLKLRKILIDNDYLENTYTDESGTFAVRGAVIDIWLYSQTQPLRIEFGTDNNITDIFTFDYNGQKIKDIEQIIFPLINKDKNAPQSLIKNWLPKFQTGIINLDFANYELWKTYKYFQPENILNLTHTPTKNLENLEIDFNLLSKNLNQTKIAELIKKYNPKKIYTTYETAVDTDKNKVNININKIQPFIYAENWYSKKLDILCLANGSKKTKTASHSQKQALFTKNIKTGDYLVHQDHGIGRFAGLITQEIDNISHEYLLLTYADGDKLYVPPYQINKLSKYIGAPHPKLNKLSGNTWPATIKKIREETIHLAHEIIELSAQRQLALAPVLAEHKTQEKQLADSFAYELTPDQLSAWQDIQNDFKSRQPMDRLLCGDVAFGKTELALRAAYRAVLNGLQVALLAPTTILVQQHYDNFLARLEILGVQIGLLSRWQTTEQIKQTLDKLRTGNIDIIIGTHRLLSRDVRFKNLQLLIVDEEQKFGVKAKEVLKKQRPLLHSLTMSATPIPRTLNYSLSGIRDISLIQTPPPGRLPITTNIIPHDNNMIKQAIKAELSRNGQVYYLVRKIKDIHGVMHNLKKLNLSANIAIAHGQLPPANLAQIMSNFDHGKIDILVTSTIIENGLDVANANTLIVDNAAHFGLAQLYQLRGRIGRGTNQGFAYLLFQRQKLTDVAARRLQTLQSAYELGAGFDIAVRDLEIRGAGNLLGKEQHGQITAIGMALYTELLEDAIERAESDHDMKPKLDVTIDLPIPSTLENNKHISTAERLNIYQKLAWENNIVNLKKLADKLLPEPRITEIKNMLTVLKLKIIANQLGIYSIEAYIKSHQLRELIIKLYLIPDHDKTYIRKLLDMNDAWQYDGSVLKINSQYLGNNWLDQLFSDLDNLTKHHILA